MELEESVIKIQAFKGSSLKTSFGKIEKELMSFKKKEVNNNYYELLKAALQIKTASSQIHEVVHGLGILLVLPYILIKDEVIKGLSLGAGSYNSSHDLETNIRIAEFKFFNWRDDNPNSARKKSLFADFFNLTRVEDSREKELYVLDSDAIKCWFETSASKIKNLLNRNSRLREEFKKLHGNLDIEAKDFYSDWKDKVFIRDLKTDPKLESANLSKIF